MSLTERFDAATAKMDELKAKLDKASKEVRESWDQGIDNFRSDMAFTKASIDEVEADRKAEKQAKREEKREKVENAVETVKESVADGVANYKSDMEILRDSLRDVAVDIDEQTDIADAKIAARKEEQVEAARAKVAAAKAKIDEFEEAIDRADQEELILDLLSYAEVCQDYADALTDEAELVLKAAAQQIALYKEKYGE